MSYIFLPALLLLSHIQVSVPTPLPPPQSKVDEEMRFRQTLQRFDCDCTLRPQGWKCKQLSAFEDYEWTHSKIGTFASDIVELSRQLPRADFSIAIQGVANSKAIYNFKTWDIVHGGCRHQHGGKITNKDLAQLRACTVGEAVDTLLDKTGSVRFLDPIDYKPSDNKYDDEYKAVIIYLLGDNGRCKGWIN